jgi:hypothetical protein
MHTGSYPQQNFQSWDCFPQVPNYQECQIISRQNKGILPYVCVCVCVCVCVFISYTNSTDQSFRSEAKSPSYSQNTLSFMEFVRLPPLTIGLYSGRDKWSPNPTFHLMQFHFNTILSSIHRSLKWDISCTFSIKVMHLFLIFPMYAE